MKCFAVLFDMDGTLLDTLQDLTDSVNELLANHGYAARTADYVRASVGNGVRALLQRTLPSPVPESLLEPLLSEYLGIYKKNMNNNTHPFDRVMDILAILKENGVKTAVVSNKPDHAVVALSKSIFGELIDLSMGEREGIPRKPDPQSIHIALTELGVKPCEALYVGDSCVDIQTAKNAGLGSVGVTWGYCDAGALIAEGADYIIDNIDGLLPLVTGS